MSGYLDLARRLRATREGLEDESRAQLESEATMDFRATQPAEIVRLTSDSRKLKAAGFEPKARGGKIIWQRPDTGFWVSQEMALHLLDAKYIRNNNGANPRR